MRGKLSDQDLTNYALNDGLDARERLYVESLLAVSEECRNDVYNMIETAQMIEEGFDREAGRGCVSLTPEQRARLIQPMQVHPFIEFSQRAAAAIAMAALAGFVLANPQVWHGGNSSSRIAKVSSKMSQMVTQAVNSSQDVDFASFVDLHTLVDDSSSWVQTANDSLPQSATICTPPSWPDSDLGSLR